VASSPPQDTADSEVHAGMGEQTGREAAAHDEASRWIGHV